ncbi:filamentous hemagglutinin N-terminal domain-containing protein [Candidatus Halobeggiatoa sp. HSG11]|nr:filamentous hemagglutinin N-terminal domain-containing protein [Candidatus Halobeggiatoa sp. HSG11]
MKSKYLLAIILLIITLSINAEIITDGTLGLQINLPGPDFQIIPDLGQQHSGNLFHSFQDFNLNSSESATFSGPNSVQNIISRVTGGNPSNIDGQLRSTIPNADFYFLNPNGIIFGPNAQLDVQGSFHASTADYLRLGNGGRFDAHNPNDSILTVAPVKAFGFLDNTIAPILIEGKGEIAPVDSSQYDSFGLIALENKTLSFIGGDISIRKGTFFKENKVVMRLNSLYAPGGRISLVGIATTGEVILGDDSLIISPTAKLANISITEQSLLNINGEGSGSLFIRGQDIIFKDSLIAAKSDGDKDNGVIDMYSNGSILFNDGTRFHTNTIGKDNGTTIRLQAGETVELSGENINGLSSRISIWTESKQDDAGDAGTLSIKAKNMYLDGSDITTWTTGKGNAGDVTIKVEETLQIGGDNPATNGSSRIYSSPFSSSAGGNGGSIQVEAQNVLIMDGSYISGTAFGPGNGANVTVHATETILLSGVNDAGYASGLYTNANPLRETGAKNAGDLTVEAGELIIEKGAMISSSSIAQKELQSGQGGNITVHVTGAINISGVNIYGENAEGLGSGIFVYSRTVDGQTGDAGNILVEADSLSITDGAAISSNTDNSAQGGNITIHINDSLAISGDSSMIKLDVAPSPTSSQKVFKEQNSEQRVSVSGIYANSSATSNNAGNLAIQARNIRLMAGGNINTSAKNAGGHIVLTTANQLYVHDGEIITSVKGGKEASGNITIENPTFIVLGQGQIKAQADAGRGGNIRIVDDQFISSPNSEINASSKLGIDGNVQIDSPAMDMDAMMVVLPGNYVEAQLPKKCRYNNVDEINTFYVYPAHKGKKRNPEDFPE